jgi:hypothetical protein
MVSTHEDDFCIKQYKLLTAELHESLDYFKTNKTLMAMFVSKNYFKYLISL